MTENAQKLDIWAIVELFGHQKVAGKCTEQNIAGVNMLRVDIPETVNQPGFTKFYGGASIYAINPVTEEVAKAMAANYEVKPITSWDIKEVTRKMSISIPESTITEPEFEEEDKHFYND
jgi:hypothetical protein